MTTDDQLQALAEAKRKQDTLLDNLRPPPAPRGCMWCGRPTTPLPSDPDPYRLCDACVSSNSLNACLLDDPCVSRDRSCQGTQDTPQAQPREPI